MSKPVICWLRRDLRLRDHLALQAAIESGQPVIPLFIFDPAILKSDRTGTPRLKFMLSALESLDTDLRDYGRRLLIRHGEPLDVLRAIIDTTDATALYFNADYTPYARQRDHTIREELSIDVRIFDDRLLMPPDSIFTNSGDPYTVYTPFKKKWREKRDERLPIAEYNLRAEAFHDLDGVQNDGVPSLADLGLSDTIDVPPASEKHAEKLLSAWIDDKIYSYADGRDRLGNPHDAPRTGTSFLSPYIRFGLVATRSIYWRCIDAYKATRSDDKRESVNTFVDEIIWHEFYTHILWHFPHVIKANFRPKYDAVQWRDAPDHLDAWKDGMTGFPVVDAAMRQLKATGWMHNRARMIVASFLTKDLLIDWREGEKHFMQWLLDGDLAANNGGWQWAAGTGTDAQPYFRIFNPVSQSKKFDPDGDFIRHWIPELCDVDKKHIHEPHNAPNPALNYPSPIVDHSEARKAALEAYQVVKEGN